MGVRADILFGVRKIRKYEKKPITIAMIVNPVPILTLDGRSACRGDGLHRRWSRGHENGGRLSAAGTKFLRGIENGGAIGAVGHLFGRVIERRFAIRRDSRGSTFCRRGVFECIARGLSSAGFSKSSTAATASVRAATTIPFRPMLVPAQAAACQVCGGDSGHEGRGGELRGGHHPAYVAGIAGGGADAFGHIGVNLLGSGRTDGTAREFSAAPRRRFCSSGVYS